MKRPWIPFWPRDYLTDTQHLTTAQHGAYLLLILHYWTAGGLPDDDGKLATIARLPLRAWRQMRPIIEAFFEMPGWHHHRIDRDIAKMDSVTLHRQVAGSIGGTRAAIARRNSSKPTSKRAANEQQTYQQNSSKRAAGLQLQEEDITTTFSGAARARQEIPENSTADPAPPAPRPLAALAADAPHGFAEKAREAVHASSSIGSGELTSLMAAKGWLR